MNPKEEGEHTDGVLKMPLQSREVVTLRLILDCDEEVGLDSQSIISTSCQKSSRGPGGLLGLPSELRLKILEHLLLFENIRTSHTRRLPYGSIDQLLNLESRRILEAPQFRHKSRQEINGVLPQYHTGHMSVAPLLVCKAIYREARSILYGKNDFMAVQCGIRGLAGRLKNYGIPTYGPINHDRLLIASRKDLLSKVQPDSADHGTLIDPRMSQFYPALILQGGSRPNAPFVVCSKQDAMDLLHAMWIMVKSPFARNMRFDILIGDEQLYTKAAETDRIIHRGAIGWLSEYLNYISFNTRLQSEELSKRIEAVHKARVSARPDEDNVHSYNSVCASLELQLREADANVSRERYFAAEADYERICYEACSVVRTRTAKLVDVSAKMPDGINRICKLIAISAYRLCELRSGAILEFRGLRRPISRQQSDDGNQSRNSSVDLGDPLQRHDLDISLTSKRREAPHVIEQAVASRHTQQMSTSTKTVTTRLEGSEAVDNALMNALLASRLPCAAPIAEWNIRLNEMLLVLFERRNNHEHAYGCMRRLQQNYDHVLKDVRAKGRKTKVDYLEALSKNLHGCIVMARSTDAAERSKAYRLALTHSHEVVAKLWGGDRLVPKSGYTGLIWTFRWA